MSERLSWHLVKQALARGLRKRCPHCGKGVLFSGWARHNDRCPSCGLIYERNPGDTWAFTILLDRLPLGLMVALVYFGVFRVNRMLGVAMFVALGAVFLLSSPNRWGIGIALHYLSRVIWPEPGDPVPANPPAPPSNPP
jgi:uncharacterized protein (DUF983 family)